MPMLPKRSCIEPGCSAVAAAGSLRCSVHTRAAQQASQRFYDDQRGTTVERGYDATTAVCGCCASSAMAGDACSAVGCRLAASRRRRLGSTS